MLSLGLFSFGVPVLLLAYCDPELAPDCDKIGALFTNIAKFGVFLISVVRSRASNWHRCPVDPAHDGENVIVPYAREQVENPIVHQNRAKVAISGLIHKFHAQTYQFWGNCCLAVCAGERHSGAVEYRRREQAG
jgi:hypothetical protein